MRNRLFCSCQSPDVFVYSPWPCFLPLFRTVSAVCTEDSDCFSGEICRGADRKCKAEGSGGSSGACGERSFLLDTALGRHFVSLFLPLALVRIYLHDHTDRHEPSWQTAVSILLVKAVDSECVCVVVPGKERERKNARLSRDFDQLASVC